MKPALFRPLRFSVCCLSPKTMEFLRCSKQWRASSSPSSTCRFQMKKFQPRKRTSDAKRVKVNVSFFRKHKFGLNQKRAREKHLLCKKTITGTNWGFLFWVDESKIVVTDLPEDHFDVYLPSGKAPVKQTIYTVI